ncbi:MFS transporter [Tropicimonas marinistellae]|uniref:MFS transporter n=1 Tax=Tropicimonas marinistellae TaxID=1739787 RepID=UPI00082BA51D|nr:MFS transporter [Tropicimonas marinistellae]
MLGFLRQNATWLAAGFFLTLTSSFGQTFFISIFAGEIRAAFGLSHGAWGAIYSAGTLASAIVMVWAGTLTDRFRVRELVLVVLPFFAAACLAMAAVPGAWALPVVIFALRLAGQGMTIHIAIVAMGRWFVASRGKALSVATLGVTLGESLAPIGFVALLGVFSWRSLWGLAALLILMVVPLLLSLLRHERTPQADIEASSAVGMDGRQWDRRSVLRNGVFWCVLPLMLAPATFVTALFFHQVHLAEIKQISHLTLVAMFPVYTACAVATMVVSGIALDWLGTARLLPFLLLPISVGFLVLAGAGGATGIALGMAAVGMTSGANSTLPNAFWAEFYGTRHLGSIKAMASAVLVFGSAVGPVVTGLAIDAGFEFDSQMKFIAIYCLAATVLAAVALRQGARRLAPTGEVDVIRA